MEALVWGFGMAFLVVGSWILAGWVIEHLGKE